MLYQKSMLFVSKALMRYVFISETGNAIAIDFTVDLKGLFDNTQNVPKTGVLLYFDVHLKSEYQGDLTCKI